MPWPENYKTALEVEQVVRSNGAIPATIAIIDGVIKVGLEDSDVKRLAQHGAHATKTSRRDVAVIVANKLTGSTTVSATSLIANKAGISIFATGGIGGVHRGGEITMDVSADLTELGRTPICVVCAGAKSILDIPRTLEYLETQGVSVIGFGTDDFPAFYVPSSGSKVAFRMDTPEECAKMIYSNHRLKLSSGMLVAVPIPAHQAANYRQVEEATQRAIEEGDSKGIKGKDITPFILSRVAKLTEGDSLRANIALIKNNAAVASRIAVALSAITPVSHVVQ